MVKKKKLPIAPGGRKGKQAGKRAVMLALDPNAYKIIQKAAEVEHRKVTQFMWHHALIAAYKYHDFGDEKKDS